jgi:hypothetical protein
MKFTGFIAPRGEIDESKFDCRISRDLEKIMA